MVDQLVPRLEVQPDARAMAQVAAAFCAERLERADRERGRSRLALSGGTTPAPVYALLGERIRHAGWGPRVEFFWGDERFVPADSPISNYHLAQATLLDPGGIDPRRVHRITTERFADVDAAAAAYATVLDRELPDTSDGFDVSIQGIGADGHTASLFPGGAALVVTDRWSVGVPEAPQPPHVPRVTLTLPMLRRSRAVALLAAGPDKASIVRQALAPACDGVPLLPAAQVRGTDETLWFLDAAAASLLPR